MGRKEPIPLSGPKPVERMTEAGARFDAAMAIFRNGWAEAYPSQPFVVDGVVTPEAMLFIEGYVAALKRDRESDA